MVLYIWLLFHQIVIACVGSLCAQQSNNHLEYLIQVGAVEMIFELAGIAKIYVKRNSNGK